MALREPRLDIARRGGGSDGGDEQVLPDLTENPVADIPDKKDEPTHRIQVDLRKMKTLGDYQRTKDGNQASYAKQNYPPRTVEPAIMKRSFLGVSRSDRWRAQLVG